MLREFGFGVFCIVVEAKNQIVKLAAPTSNTTAR